MWPVRIIALLGCAEWLLIFRTWVSFRYLLLYAGFTFLRLVYLMGALPHWDNNYLLVGVSFIAVIWHLRSLWRANTAQNQQTYDTPETGVPWLVIVAQNPKRAFALECVIITVFIFYLFSYGRLILPSGFQSISTAKALAGISAFWMLFSYSLWNLAVSGRPLWRSRATPPADPYQHVREQEHAPPPLPTVKELSDNLE